MLMIQNDNHGYASWHLGGGVCGDDDADFLEVDFTFPGFVTVFLVVKEIVCDFSAFAPLSPFGVGVILAIDAVLSVVFNVAVVFLSVVAVVLVVVVVFVVVVVVFVVVLFVFEVGVVVCSPSVSSFSSN